MYFSMYERWDKRIAYYNDDNLEFVSKKIIEDYEIAYDNSLKPHSEYNSCTISALDIAIQFAKLHKLSDNDETFIASVINFIEKYGMMGINRVKQGMGYKEAAYGYSESLFKWEEETLEMYRIFEKLKYLKENHCSNELHSITLDLSHTVNEHLTEVHPYLITDHSNQEIAFNNKKEEKASKLLANQYLILKTKENNSTITTDEKSQLIKYERNLIEKYNVDVIALEESGKLYKSNFFPRPMIRSFNLLNSMYFAIFQAMQEDLSITICEKCGSPFVITPRKKIKDKCSDCVIKSRNERKNKTRRSDPVNKFKENIGQRVNYHLNETLNIPIEKEFHLINWYEGLLKEDTSNISNKKKWIKEKDEEFYQILEKIKKED